MNSYPSNKRHTAKTVRMRQLESEKDRLAENLDETQATIRQLKRAARDAQLRLRQINGEILVESFRQPVLRLVYDRDTLTS